MGIRYPAQEELARLECKTLDSRFLTEIQEGLDISPFAAKAVLKVVKDVYFPFLETEATRPTPAK